MSAVQFSKEEREEITAALQDYLKDELELEAGGLAASLLVDFITERLGGYYYNRGLYDAQALLSKRADELAEAILELEKPTKLGR